MLKPMNVSGVLQSSSLLPAKPIRKRAFENFRLKPSLLQFGCNEESSIRDTHSALPAFVAA